MNGAREKRSPASELVTIRPEWLRRALDLQYRGIVIQMASWIASRGGKRAARVLDVGSGSCPYARLFPPDTEFVTVDPATAADYSGIERVPLAPAFDIALVIEVLEHVRDPVRLLREISRRLGPGGEIWVSVPFAARIHRVPEDYWRWTDAGLRELVRAADLEIVELRFRGNEIATLVAKYCHLLFRFVSRPLLRAPALAVGAVTLPWALPLGHLGLVPRKSPRDPLGMMLRVRRRTSRRSRRARSETAG